jgi:L-cysteine desulfidase
MHIIFGDAIKEIPDSFTVLELDTFRRPGQQETFTAYCVVEKLPLGEFFSLDSFKKIHADLIKFYKQRQWTYCEHAIEGLLGKWNGELDSFYLNLLERIGEYKTNPPSEEWDGSILRI